MPWQSRLAIAGSLFLSTAIFNASAAAADDGALWQEYGLVHSENRQQGKLKISSYEMKDLTGAIAAWQWQRSTRGRSCELATFCSQEPNRTVLSDFNYVLILEGAQVKPEEAKALLESLPNKRDSALPALLTFIPKQGLVPNSTRYMLGPVSFAAFAPQLASWKPGFESGAEAQVADYQLERNGGQATRLGIFYYPTPEMARLYASELRKVSGVHVKRSGVLVAVALPPASAEQSDTLLSRIQYEAKVTWNDVPPPSPIKPLYQLLMNIIYLSIVLSALCLAAGLVYAGMRLYRRRYGTLEADEAMTTLHLTGD